MNFTASPATIAQKRPACLACSKSKRKCDRQLPSCNRCRKKKLRCAYALAPVLRVFLDGDTREPSQVSRDVDERYLWFLEPDSWKIDQRPAATHEDITYPESGLELYFERFRSWIDNWTNSGHCVFIHRRLYGSELPGSLQYAYGAWVSYRAGTTPSSKKTVLKIVECWAKSLVQEHSLYESLGNSTEDIRTHLSRVQALLILQFIGLFDGDIKARAEAEALSENLIQWADTLMHRFPAEIAHLYPTGSQRQAYPTGPGSERSDTALLADWQAYLLSESIRRTWIVAGLTHAAFLIVKQGFARCPGTITFTGREGLWDASSAHIWTKILASSSSAQHPVSCRGLQHLVEGTSPLDVDEFTKTFLAYGIGRERYEDWVATSE